MNLKDELNYQAREFTIQWHITNDCDMRCKHCYIPHEIKSDNRNKLSKTRSMEIIDELRSLCLSWGVHGRINFSGGNPLLDNDFFELAGYASKNNIRVGILGNPTSLTNKNIVQKLKKLPVWRYQISIDGLQENHDFIRGNGNFKIALEGLDMLVANNIPSVVLSTITRNNMQDIPELAKLVFEKGVKVYDFARIVPTGESEDWKDLLPRPCEYRDFLLRMFNSYLDIKKHIPNARIGVKDPLWLLLYRQLGLLRPIADLNKIYGGCSVGINGFCLDVDGTAYSCRRMEVPIGNAQTQSIYDIFINSAELNNQRKFENIEGCCECDIMPVCRGCLAISHKVNGSYFTKDPSCWRDG